MRKGTDAETFNKIVCFILNFKYKIFFKQLVKIAWSVAKFVVTTIYGELDSLAKR